MTLIETITNAVTILPIEGSLGVIAILAIVADTLQDRLKLITDPVDRARDALGVSGIPRVPFVIGSTLWVLLTLALTLGLFGMIWMVLSADASQATGTDFRFLLAQLTAMTAVLGAVVALPVTLNRLRLQKEADKTAKESLFNEKIVDATKDLYARRQVTKWVGRFKNEAQNGWDDDITRRNAAIDRLEGLVRERPEVAERVSRLLSVYIRELSAKGEVAAVSLPNDTDRKDWRRWARSLKPRSDMENAVQTLGRMRAIEGVNVFDVEIDLTYANLQGMNLQGSLLSKVDFSNASLQGARLNDAQLQSAVFTGAQLQGTSLNRAQLEKAILLDAEMNGANFRDVFAPRAKFDGADLQWTDFSFAHLYRASFFKSKLDNSTFSGAQMQRVTLNRAHLSCANMTSSQLQGANLNRIKTNTETSFAFSNLFGARLKSTDQDTILLLKRHWNTIFVGWHEIRMDVERPLHWPKNAISRIEFKEQWRAWQRSIGQDPENPE